VLAHMNQTADTEWAAVADSGAHVTLTPETEIQMSMGWPVIGPARVHGIKIFIIYDPDGPQCHLAKA
jgi:cytosine/adenosine deaminase-related metal-dependent hydrolase